MRCGTQCMLACMYGTAHNACLQCTYMLCPHRSNIVAAGGAERALYAGHPFIITKTKTFWYENPNFLLQWSRLHSCHPIDFCSFKVWLSQFFSDFQEKLSFKEHHIPLKNWFYSLLPHNHLIKQKVTNQWVAPYRGSFHHLWLTDLII